MKGCTFERKGGQVGIQKSRERVECIKRRGKTLHEWSRKKCSITYKFYLCHWAFLNILFLLERGASTRTAACVEARTNRDFSIQFMTKERGGGKGYVVGRLGLLARYLLFAFILFSFLVEIDLA